MTVGHIGINVNNLAVSTQFYQDIFDFEILGESTKGDKKFAFLGNKGELLLTLWEQSDKKFSDTTAGLHHLAFILKSREELNQFEQKIDKLNVKKIYNDIVSHAEDMGSGGLYFYDPDGSRLEVYITEGLEEYKPATADAPSCGFF
ncbi:MAG: VOC family protein [Thiovulaceae bacterium]|nr:VOC family protein [Sulfurimonadaceae bacterium]